MGHQHFGQGGSENIHIDKFYTCANYYDYMGGTSLCKRLAQLQLAQSWEPLVVASNHCNWTCRQMCIASVVLWLWSRPDLMCGVSCIMSSCITSSMITCSVVTCADFDKDIAKKIVTVSSWNGVYSQTIRTLQPHTQASYPCKLAQSGMLQVTNTGPECAVQVQ